MQGDVTGLSNLTAALAVYFQHQNKFNWSSLLPSIIAILSLLVTIFTVYLNHKKNIEIEKLKANLDTEKEINLKAFEIKCRKLLELYEKAVDLYFWSPGEHLDDDLGRNKHIEDVFQFKFQVQRCKIYDELNLCDDALKLFHALWEWHRVDLKTFGFNEKERKFLSNHYDEANRYFESFCKKILEICHLDSSTASKTQTKKSQQNSK